MIIELTSVPATAEMPTMFRQNVPVCKQDSALQADLFQIRFVVQSGRKTRTSLRRFNVSGKHFSRCDLSSQIAR